MRTEILFGGPPIRVSPPTALPLSLAELRAQCRLTDDDGTDDDPRIMGHLRAAVDYAENYTGLALITQTFKQSYSGFGAGLMLSRRPVQSIVAIDYLDSGEAPIVLGSGLYRTAAIGSVMMRSSIWPSSSVVAWPDTSQWLEAVTVTYVAGMGDDHNAVPEQIRQALLMLTAYYYEQTTAALIDPKVVEVPFGVDVLLDPWCLPAVA